ncbi:MAG: hypothetical protein IT201_02585 [Thermoleophilia bacterium]|nr:hypothetical protein [Thermoleophilia bacterium]
MYDGLTARYTFRCPAQNEARVRLSAFRTLERLPGAGHPAVFEVRFSCSCGGDHTGLVPHDELDWAPLGAGTVAAFLNVMTGRLEPAAADLADHAAARIKGGAWPWSLFCYAEGRPQPVFPSTFRLLAPEPRGAIVAARCPSCQRTSVNLVSVEHVDVPFYSDPEVGVVEHLFTRDGEESLAALAGELAAGRFEAVPRRLAA